MTREEELKVLQEFIKKNGTTKLPPGSSGPEIVFSAWGKPKKKRGRKKKQKTS